LRGEKLVQPLTGCFYRSSNLDRESIVVHSR
jgi:hypothetical protein